MEDLFFGCLKNKGQDVNGTFFVNLFDFMGTLCPDMMACPGGFDCIGPGAADDLLVAGFDTDHIPAFELGQEGTALFVDVGGLGVGTWCTTKAEAMPVYENLFVLESDELEPLIKKRKELTEAEVETVINQIYKGK